MLEGRFGNTSGAPYLEARIVFPRLKLKGLISFLVDTGADGTILMPADSTKSNIDFRTLRNPTTSEGIGGEAKGYNETAILSFSDRRHIFSYRLQMDIAAPTRTNQRFPSLLGRDILDKWRFVMDFNAPRDHVYAALVGFAAEDLSTELAESAADIDAARVSPRSSCNVRPVHDWPAPLARRRSHVPIRSHCAFTTFCVSASGILLDVVDL